MIIALIKNYVIFFFLLDWSVFKYGSTPTPQRSYDESRQNLQSQVYLRHVFEEHYIRNDANQVRI